MLLLFSSHTDISGESIRRRCAEYEDRSTVRIRALYLASFAAASTASAWSVFSPPTTG
ncbi:hypothetical protein ACFZCG_19210 [Streptomyces tanashiensis]|uniref:hypothetical protein n=1 Tax=Streptomyces tanashiensis TaxID=67367 RepID=UPI0036EC749E